MPTRKNRPGAGRPSTGGVNEVIAIRWQPWIIEGIERYGKQLTLDRPAALRHLVITSLAKQRLVDPRHLQKPPKKKKLAVAS